MCVPTDYRKEKRIAVTEAFNRKGKKNRRNNIGKSHTTVQKKNSQENSKKNDGYGNNDNDVPSSRRSHGR